jgi:SAM-dependent methyltransferase
LADALFDACGRDFKPVHDTGEARNDEPTKSRFTFVAVIEKNVEESVEFYVPDEGLDVRHYLAKELPDDASVAEKGAQKQAVHHLARYHWATEVLRGTEPGVVLDLACGGGYGSFMLAEALPDHTVIGGDYDPRAVDHARTNFDAANLSFRKVDAVTWHDLDRDEPLGRVDYVVSFDTIEHLLHREIMLINVAEALPAHGMLLLSTPCGHEENQLFPGWSHHKIEYAYVYLYNLMRRFFDRLLIPNDGSLPGLEFWNTVVNSDRERYPLRANPMVCLEPRSFGLDTPRLDLG